MNEKRKSFYLKEREELSSYIVKQKILYCYLNTFFTNIKKLCKNRRNKYICWIFVQMIIICFKELILLIIITYNKSQNRLHLTFNYFITKLIIRTKRFICCVIKIDFSSRYDFNCVTGVRWGKTLYETNIRYFVPSYARFLPFLIKYVKLISIGS